MTTFQPDGVIDPSELSLALATAPVSSARLLVFANVYQLLNAHNYSVKNEQGKPLYMYKCAPHTKQYESIGLARRPTSSSGLKGPTF